jgi:hypothetical protein
MIYHLMSILYSLVKKIIIDMGVYPYGDRQRLSKSTFLTHKETPELKWLDGTFVYFLIKQEIIRSDGHSLSPTVCSPPPIAQASKTPIRASSGITAASFEVHSSGITPTTNATGVVSSSEREILQQKEVPVARVFGCHTRLLQGDPTSTIITGRLRKDCCSLELEGGEKGTTLASSTSKNKNLMYVRLALKSEVLNRNIVHCVLLKFFDWIR